MAKQTKYVIFMLLTTIIWGLSFVAQSKGTETVGPLSFNGTRSLLGALSLLPVYLLQRRKEGRLDKAMIRSTVKNGILCGIALGLAGNIQQIGIMHTTIGKAGFLTTLYVVIVPLMGLLGHKGFNKRLIVGLPLAIVGIYLMSVTDGLTMGKGDVLCLVGAVFFALQIILVEDALAKNCDGILLSIVQMLTVFVPSLLIALFTETISLEAMFMGPALVPLLYAGIMSCGVAYTLQIMAQKGLESSTAALIMSLESCFALLFGFLILGQKLSAREIIGCAMAFGAVLAVRLPLPSSLKTIRV